VPRLIIVIAGSFEGQRREGLRHLDFSASVTTRLGSLRLPAGPGFTSCGFHCAGMGIAGVSNLPGTVGRQRYSPAKMYLQPLLGLPPGCQGFGTVQKAAVDSKWNTAGEIR
jgi:hypothetical protein